MNMDIKELPRIWQNLDKVLVLTIAGTVVAVALTAVFLPGAISAISENGAVQAEHDQVETSVSQRMALLQAQPAALQQSIDQYKAEAQSLASDMATTDEANAVLGALYDKAGRAGVSVTRIDPIIELGDPDSPEPTAYDKQQVVVEAVGSAQNLLRFLELVSDFGIDSYGIEVVTMTKDTTLTLTFDVIGYASDYAGQDVPSVSLQLIKVAEMWG